MNNDPHTAPVFHRRLLAFIGGFVSVAILASLSYAGPRIPAFPEAEGAGAWTPGGRGGPAIIVSTLEDYDPDTEKALPGSLRAAIESKGPRIIIFRVAGTIQLKADLEIKEPFVTLAGQSAPGGGIALRRYPLQIQTHDVVVRHLRVRPGDEAGKEMDGLSCNGQNVVIDHCSVSWGIDETLSVTSRSANVTVQWCIIAESLNASVHQKGEHGYGSLINGEGPISFHHNLYAHHRSRNPRPGDVDLDFRNNVIYGWRDRAGYSSENIARMNLAGNYFRPGPLTRDRNFMFSPGGPEFLMHLEGNILEGAPAALEDQWKAVRPIDDYTPEETAALLKRDRPFPFEAVAPEPAEEALKRVLAGAGATLPERDSSDARVVSHVRNRLGRIIDSPKEAGGWPELAAGNPPPDSDADGMPDAWETVYRLDPANAADGPADADGDGYTNLEEHLNGTDPNEPFAWVEPPVIAVAGDKETNAASHYVPFIGEVEVRLSSPAAAGRICYTIDGSPPDAGKSNYSGSPLRISATTHLRALAAADGIVSREAWAVFEKLALHPAAATKSAQPGLAFDYYEAEEWEDFPHFEDLTPVRSGVAGGVDLKDRSREEGYGIVYSGFIEAPADGIYHFYSRSNERTQLYIAGQKVVESKGRDVTRAGNIALAKGRHPLRALIYFQFNDRNVYEVAWEGPGVPRGPIPPSALYHELR